VGRGMSRKAWLEMMAMCKMSEGGKRIVKVSVVGGDGNVYYYYFGSKRLVSIFLSNVLYITNQAIGFCISL
jgi:hypothetical protein